MPKLFDEFDLDLQKVSGIKPMSDDGGNSIFACGSGTDSCGCTDSCSETCGCPTFLIFCWE